MQNPFSQNDIVGLMSVTQDLSKRKIGKWSILHFDSYKKKKAFWFCKCDCGTLRSVSANNLLSNGSKSCGCDNRNIKHGLSGHSLYSVWEGMRQRCLNTKATDYHNYGGRGITVCERWNSFSNFYEDMSLGYSDNLKIDRIDNNGNYEPSNCRWATQKEQINNRRKTIRLNINGVLGTVEEWSNISGTNKQTIHTRYFRGYSDYECVYGKNKILHN